MISWDDIGYVRIPLRGEGGIGQYAIVDGDYDGEYLSGFKWYRNKVTGYVYRKATSDEIIHKRWPRHGTVLLHHMVLKAPKGMTVDHINRDKLDNRSKNLRIVSQSRQCQNRQSQPNKHGYKGIKFSDGRYRAYVGHKLVPGGFTTALEAALAWDEAAFEVYGIYGIYNFPHLLGLGDEHRHMRKMHE